MMGERTPVGSPHPGRSVPSTPGQGPSSHHPNGVMQSGGLILTEFIMRSQAFKFTFQKVSLC